MASSALIFGLFSLTNGHRHTVRTTHVVYTTYIQCDNDTSIEGEARMYSPASRPILPDNTVAFMYAKFVAPDNGNILLEAIRLIPFIGDEITDEYQDIFSDECFATIVAYGAVPTPHTVHDSRKHFPLAISDYVRDSVQQSQIEFVAAPCFLSFSNIFDRCVLDTSTPRWANTRPPAANSSAQVVGVCHGLNSSGRLLVNVESLTYIPAATTAAATPVTPSPKKRVKYGPKTPRCVY